MEKKRRRNDSSAAFKIGAVCIIFLVIGYQAALFINRAAVLRIEANRDRPDTVFITHTPEDAPAAGAGHSSGSGRQGGGTAARSTSGSTRRGEAYGSDTIRRQAAHSAKVLDIRQRTRRVESFRFDPNTVSVEDLTRLGFTEKQAMAIENYRAKGGRFRRKSDFAKSFVVADSVYRRLERFIDIPSTDINRADSAAFDDLPGIGPYFAAKMVEYRERLCGYSYPEQLMDIYNFGEDRFESLKDLITCSPPEPYGLWSLPAEELRRHPYIGGWKEAKAIVLYRENTPAGELSVEGIVKAGILPPENAGKLARCHIAPP